MTKVNVALSIGSFYKLILCTDLLSSITVLLLFSITIYHLLYQNLLPSLSEYTTQNATLTLRQAIYYSLLASSGGTQSGSHKCNLLYDVFCLYSTTAHLVLISYPGRVYFSCSQHLHRTGSSYQCIKTDPALLIKISVILGVLVTISGIFLYIHILSLNLNYWTVL